ncbi:MAG: RluA family pseudouridine synthase [Desulfobacterales bacterium]
MGGPFTDGSDISSIPEDVLRKQFAGVEGPFHRAAILFENEALIALDKPEKLASIPERNPRKPSLLQLLKERSDRRVYVVHRLDKEVSGVILFAKTPEAHRHLCLLFEQRRVRKTYAALVHGGVEGPRGTIELPLRRFGSGRMGVDEAAGKPCRTDYEVRGRIAGFTELEVYPHTGRKHQIRAHLFSLGHPVAGDRLYGKRAEQAAFPRLMLHARKIEFETPDGDWLLIESPLPPSFTETLRRLRREGAATDPAQEPSPPGR